MPEIKINEKNDAGYGKCLELTNGIVDLIVTVDYGPRIIRYGFLGGPNEFCADAQLTVNVGDDEWRLRGGHRLWHSPEAYPRSYCPDNEPVGWEMIDNGIKVTCQMQPWVQVVKEMEITLSPATSEVKVLHRLINKNAWPVELAAWALSVMAPGGVGIIPLPQYKAHFTEGAKGLKIISVWSYTQMNDPRIHWGEKYISVSQDTTNPTGMKIGTLNKDGWIAYINRNHMFVKKFTFSESGRYPDGGVNCEVYGCNFMLEIESLSPLTLVPPDCEIIHIEEWKLFDHIEDPAGSETKIEEIIKKKIE